jgi:hypothetical protein
MARTIQSPGVEINEIDLTLRPVAVEGTSVFVAGFANQGPIDEIIQPTSISEFEQIYGSPTNSAERYFYHTVRNVLNSSPANVVVSRLPYGEARGDGFETWRYSALAYPVKSVKTESVELSSTTYSVSSINVTFSGAGYNPLSGVDVHINGEDEPSITVNYAYNSVLQTYGISSVNVPTEITGFVSASRLVSFVTTVSNVTAASAVAFGGSTFAGTGNYTFITNDSSLSGATTYFVGRPTHVELTSDEYQSIIEGNIDWSNTPSVSTIFAFETLGDSSIIVLNKAQTTVNNKFEGYYLGVADNNNFNPATQFNSVVSVNGIQSSENSIIDYTRVPNSRLNFSLSATQFGDGTSVSEVMENLTQFDLGDNTFQDTISLGLFKLRQSIFTPDTISLDYVLSENYTGSLDYHRQIADSNGGPAQTFFLGRLSDSSPNINVIINPYISNRFQNTWLDNNGVPSKKVRFLTKQLQTPFANAGNFDTNDSYITRVGAASATVASIAQQYGYADSLFPVGIYNNTVTVNKTVGNLPQKLNRVFELVDNSDLYPINVALEAGLGTVYVNAIEQSGSTTNADIAGTFIDSTPLNTLSSFYTTNFEDLDSNGLRIRSNYTSVANIFVNAAEKQRKDFLVILDPIRNIFVQGENSKTINAKKIFSPNVTENGGDGYVMANFSQHIYWPLRHQFGTINSSYATTYANWAQVIDPQTNRQIWVPFSGFAAAAMANTDSNFQPWFAPAGFTRGVVVGANDLGIYPKQKQRDQLYKISLNPVAFYPNEGFVIFGQKTLLKKPSAFDRINVRRLFLNLETSTKNTAKFFVFEPNTLFTRTQVINALSPIFENAKNTEGLYDYRIVCSELNNTPEVIDNNELKIDIYIQPVRTAEFILVNFYATRTGTNFDEILGV